MGKTSQEKQVFVNQYKGNYRFRQSVISPSAWHSVLCMGGYTESEDGKSFGMSSECGLATDRMAFIPWFKAQLPMEAFSRNMVYC